MYAWPGGPVGLGVAQPLLLDGATVRSRLSFAPTGHRPHVGGRHPIGRASMSEARNAAGMATPEGQDVGGVGAAFGGRVQVAVDAPQHALGVESCLALVVARRARVVDA